jgi:uncharacterized membrane protein YbaN (DUF454 family)
MEDVLDVLGCMMVVIGIVGFIVSVITADIPLVVLAVVACGFGIALLRGEYGS